MGAFDFDRSGKGRIVLATVMWATRHGANSVDIIQVVNIVSRANRHHPRSRRRTRAPTVGMSGLLVKSTVVMKENLRLNTKAESSRCCSVARALTRSYAETTAEIYQGEVRATLAGLCRWTLPGELRGEAPDETAPKPL